MKRIIEVSNKSTREVLSWVDVSDKSRLEQDMLLAEARADADLKEFDVHLACCADPEHVYARLAQANVRVYR